MILYITFALVLLITAYIIGLEIWYKLSYFGKCVDKYPGLPKLPIIGHLKHFDGGAESVFRKLRECSKEFYPVYKIMSFKNIPIICLISPNDIQKVLSNVKHNEKSMLYLPLWPWLKDGLLLSKGEKWVQRRKILTPTFHFAILKRFVGVFEKHCRKSVESLRNYTEMEIDILPVVHKCSLHMIAEAAMGVELTNDSEEKKYRSAIHKLGQIFLWQLLHPWLAILVLNVFTITFYVEAYILYTLSKFTNRIIKARSETFKPQILEESDLGSKKRLAMLDLLLKAKQDGLIDDAGIKEEVDTFTFEGHDTISSGISLCCMLLANNRDIQTKVYEEIVANITDRTAPLNMEDLQNLTYTEMVIKESLRLYPSVPLISRIAGEDFETEDGNVVPKGAMVLMQFYDTHRRPEIYPNPERFDPERFSAENCKNRHPFAYLPFSAGSRNCIGQRYAILAMKSMLLYMLSEYELFPIDTPETIVFLSDLVLRPKNGIKLMLKRRTKITNSE